MSTGYWGQLEYKVYSRYSVDATVSVCISEVNTSNVPLSYVYQITYEGVNINTKNTIIYNAKETGNPRWTTFHEYVVADSVHLQVGENVFTVYWLCEDSAKATNFKDLIFTTSAYSSTYTSSLINLSGR